MSDLLFELAIVGDLEKWAERGRAAYRAGLESAVREEGLEVQRKLRADVENAGLGTGVANAWRLEIFNNRDSGEAPAAFLWSAAAGIIDSFERGGTVAAKDGAMAVPIPGSPAAAMRIRKGEHLVAKVEERFGKLQLVVTPRGAMLVAKGRQTTSGRLAPLQERKSRSGGIYVATKGVASIPMFWLVRDVRLEKKLNWRAIGDAARPGFAARVESRLQSRFDAAAAQNAVD